MNASLATAMVLSAGALMAWWRFARLLRAANATTSRTRIVQLLQPVIALLLYFTLLPPLMQRSDHRLVLLTAKVTPAQVARYRHRHNNATVLALPEAPMLPGIARVPDVATALRQHAGITQLHVLGVGLVARDRAVAAALPLAFEPAPLPLGLLQLWSPTQVTTGDHWRVSGRTNAVLGASVELRDPSGQRVAFVKPDKDGRFTLVGRAPAPGRVEFQLRVLGKNKERIEDIALPLEIVPGARLRVLILAGGPSPELKYLRRWALDAGMELHTQIALGGGMALGDKPISFDAATLRGFDLAVLDERSWRDLGAARKIVLHDAVRAGLGVLLRLAGPLSAGERVELQKLGFMVNPTNANLPVSLRNEGAEKSLIENDVPATPEEAARVAEEAAALQLSRQAFHVAAVDTVPLLRDATGAPLALWRSEGQGRLSLWWLSDSHRLVLAGQFERYGQLWSDAFAQLARVRQKPLPKLISADLRVRQRVQLCGLGDKAHIETSTHQQIELWVDANASGDRCAVYWPTESGWHRVVSGESALSFSVRTQHEVAGLAAYSNQQATQLLVNQSDGNRALIKQSVPGPRWPWFLGWLLTAGIAWWLERRWLRVGKL